METSILGSSGQNSTGQSSRMSQTHLVQSFIQALKQGEQTGDIKSLSALFSPQAILQNLTRPGVNKADFVKPEHTHSASSFWRQYLSVFENIQSQFTNIIDNGKEAVLEWRSVGKFPAGIPVEYSGVSILEYSNGLINKFRTYYDSAALLPHSPTSKKRFSESVGSPGLTNEAGA